MAGVKRMDMKVLFFSQAIEKSDQPDFDASFRAALKDREFRNIPYLGYARKYGWKEFYKEVLRQNEDFCPDLIFFQFFHCQGGMGIRECCKNLKEAKNKPLIFGSLGDLFYTGPLKYLARPIPKVTLELAQNADAMFSTSMGNVADELVKNGARNVIFLPHAFCPEHFPDWEVPFFGVPKYNITMLGSKGKWITRSPLASFCNTWKRRYVARLLSAEFGSGFSVFGHGWEGPSATGTIPFKEQLHIYKQSRVVVDSPAPILETTYYASDRPFFMLASGTPMVYFYTPRFEKILKPDVHAKFVYNFNELVGACRQLSNIPRDVVDAKRSEIQAFVKERHMVANRVDTILSTAQAINAFRTGDIDAAEALKRIRMWHFLPEVDMRKEYKYAIANWVG